MFWTRQTSQKYIRPHLQSRSQSFVPLDQQSENESAGQGERSSGNEIHGQISAFKILSLAPS